METAFGSEQRFTQDQFCAWLEGRPASDVNRYELIGGRVFVSPPSRWPHGAVEAVVSARIGWHVQAAKLGTVLGSSAGHELPSGDTLEPDLSFISNERFARGPSPVWGRFLRIVPTLVIEILSPSTERRDRIEKLDIYARNGVDECWLVDPLRREVAVFESAGAVFAAPRPFTSGVIASQVLPALELRVEALFADLA